MSAPGGYVTRGRAAELEERIDELERRLTLRLGELERDVRDAEEESRAAKRLVLDLARKGLSAVLDVYRDAIGNDREEIPRGDHT